MTPSPNQMQLRNSLSALLWIALLQLGCRDASPAQPAQPDLPAARDTAALSQIKAVQAQAAPPLPYVLGAVAEIACSSPPQEVTWQANRDDFLWGSITNRGDTLEDYFLGLTDGFTQGGVRGYFVELLIPVSAARSGAVLRENTVEKNWLLRVHNADFHSFSTDTLPLMLQIDEWDTAGKVVSGRLSGKLDDALSDNVVWVKSLFFRVHWELDSLYVRMEE